MFQFCFDKVGRQNMSTKTNIFFLLSFLYQSLLSIDNLLCNVSFYFFVRCMFWYRFKIGLFCIILKFSRFFNAEFYLYTGSVLTRVKTRGRLGMHESEKADMGLVCMRIKQIDVGLICCRVRKVNIVNRCFLFLWGGERGVQNFAKCCSCHILGTIQQFKQCFGMY